MDQLHPLTPVGRWLVGLMMLCGTAAAPAQNATLLHRLWNYADSVRAAAVADATGSHADTLRTNVYTRYHVDVQRRNFLMLAVPHMFQLGHDRQRQYFGETYSAVTTAADERVDAFRHLHLSTSQRRRTILRHLTPYLSPHIYGITLVGEDLLSPFHYSNRGYYRYLVETADSACSHVTFHPKVRNTQTLQGTALVETATGRILNCRIEGEWDMVRFVMLVVMGPEGMASLRAERCSLDVTATFFWNRMQASFLSVNDLPATLPRTIDDSDSLALMQSLRPEPLSAEDSLALAEADSLRRQTRQQAEASAADVSSGRRLHHIADAVWDAVNDNMLRRIRLDIGPAGRNHFSIGPLFNPLYMSYSSSQGFIYRLSMEFSYTGRRDNELHLGLRGGYAFRQRRLYFSAPLRYTFNRCHEAWVEASVSNGNEITNSTLLDQLNAMPRSDSIRFDTMSLDYFRDLTMRVKAHYAFGPRLSAYVGGVFHRRSAVNKQSFHEVGEPSVYKTLAPMAGLTLRPLGKDGPVVRAEYEHGIGGFSRSAIDYDRTEVDAAYTLPLPGTRQLSMRVGGGWFSSRRHGMYFIDYSNFYRNQLSGGWIDDALDFKLLDSHWYNASDYYARMGGIYESPLLLLTHLPLVGRYVERERLYFNALAVRHLTPYVEAGYTLRNSVFSAGVFAAFSNKGFEDVGVSLGLELFEHW